MAVRLAAALPGTISCGRVSSFLSWIRLHCLRVAATSSNLVVQSNFVPVFGIP